MNRREFIQTSSLTAASLFAGCSSFAKTLGGNGLSNKRLNNILVITDDQEYGDLSS